MWPFKKKIKVPEFDAVQAQALVIKSKLDIDKKQLDLIKEAIKKACAEGQSYVYWHFIPEGNVKSLEALGFKINISKSVIPEYKVTW